VKLPTDIELKAVLGSADVLWSGIVHAVEGMCVPIEQQWKPSKAEFGRMCLLRHKKRTLLYMTPDKQKVWIAIILGERAYGLVVFRRETLCRRPRDSFSGEFIERGSDDYTIGADQDHA
jgi:hypothetical protein